MRADRLLSILLIFQSRGLVTARELAAELEVSERTIHRDMEALSTAGIPVMSVRGIHGGWRLLEGYRANLVGLNAAEIQTLFMRQPAGLLADLGLEEAGQAALLKLFAALPNLYRPHADAMRQYLHIDLTGWNRSKEDVSCLPTIQQALWNGCKLNLNYRRSEGEPIERIVDPLGLVAKGSVWYLVAGIEGDIRTYRVSRILGAAILDQPCERPADFDLGEYWTQTTAQFFATLPKYHLVVRAAPEILPRLRYAGTFAKIEKVEPPDAEGWSVVHLHFDIPEEAREFALGFGTFIQVLEPAELRREVIDMARAVLQFYGEE
jgi:predicted DNA-binding transcriptional regulator YafY